MSSFLLKQTRGCLLENGDSYQWLLSARRNGSIGEDDSVSVDIDSQNSRHGYSTFQVTVWGTQNEYLEGGAADNITWAGDWKAATMRIQDSWTAEMSIPFALLRYPKGAKAFGIDLSRKLAREPSVENWPYLPFIPGDFSFSPVFEAAQL